MKPVNSNEALGALLKPYMRREYTTNQLQLPSAFYGRVERLYYTELDNGLLLYEDLRLYYRVYYFLTKLEIFESVSALKPLVMELPCRGRYAERETAFWTGMGFAQEALRIRMEKAAETAPATPVNHGVLAAKPCMNDMVHRFLEGEFDRYTGFLPTEDELRAAIEAGSVLYVPDGSGGIAGALHFGRERRVSEVFHLAVAENHRKRGVAQALLNVWMSGADAGTRLRLWVSESSNSALSLYRKNGFEHDGWFCTTLLRK